MLFPAARAWLCVRGQTWRDVSMPLLSPCAPARPRRLGRPLRRRHASRRPAQRGAAALARCSRGLSGLPAGALGSLALLRRVSPRRRRSGTPSRRCPTAPSTPRALGRRLVALPHVILFAPTLVLALVLVVATWLRLPPWTDATKASFFVLAVVADVVAAVRGCRTSGREHDDARRGRRG